MSLLCWTSIANYVVSFLLQTAATCKVCIIKLILVGVVSLSAFRGKNALAETSLGCNWCPLSRVGRCPLLGGSTCTVSMGKSIRGHEICLLSSG